MGISMMALLILFLLSIKRNRVDDFFLYFLLKIINNF
jgi:hypothetical protein